MKMSDKEKLDDLKKILNSWIIDTKIIIMEAEEVNSVIDNNIKTGAVYDLTRKQAVELAEGLNKIVEIMNIQLKRSVDILDKI